MPSPLLSGRRAERFARLLDEAGGGPRHHGRSPDDPELTGMVELRHRLVTATPAVEVNVDQEFRSSLRAMLVATAERDGIGTTDTTTPVTTGARLLGLRSRGPRARTAILAGIAVGTIAFAGMSQASDSAVPGDALYGLKRSTERAQLALANSDIGRGQLYFDFARTRLEEAHRVAPGLDRTLADMDRDTVRGARLLTGAATERDDPAALDAIEQFVTGQREILDELANQVDGPDLVRIATSRQLLDRIERRTEQARHDLVCANRAANAVDPTDPTLAECGTALPSAGRTEPGSAARPPQQRPATSGGTSADYTTPGSTTGGGNAAAPTPAPTPSTATASLRPATSPSDLPTTPAPTGTDNSPTATPTATTAEGTATPTPDPESSPSATAPTPPGTPRGAVPDDVLQRVFGE